MLFSGSSAIILKPSLPNVAFGLLLQQWLDAQFEPAECQRRFERLVEAKRLSPELFRPEEIQKGGVVATDPLLFGAFGTPVRDWTLYAQAKRGQELLRSGLRLPVESVAWVAQLIRAAGYTQDVEDLRGAAASHLTSRFAQVFGACLEPAEDEASYGAWPAVDAPGIYRREHASLVIRSKTTTLLLDPQVLSLGEATHFSRYPRESGPLDLDAILITHQHEDHWYLPSILRYASRPDLPIIVPQVPRPNLLTPEDFSASLGQVGLKAIAPAWGSTLRVGDIDIDILPFYGEQPTAGSPGPADGLRSWGNCYRFTTPEFSAVVLVDSGSDPMGDMVEAVRQNTEQRGPADVVLSNFRSFPEVINIGLPQYALTLPFEQLRATFAQHRAGNVRSMTLGVEGVARASMAAQARYVLPYAHMFQGIGVDADANLVEGVRTGLGSRGATTEVLAWNPGDVARFENGRLHILRGPPAVPNPPAAQLA
ncbi:MBL fold metallo-hydrolase [Archangium lansingense]|uniref:MBL fold metallo-hydrolase n=1 Tax=Archangium lansingense TaxID=2995310 RepID=UPI003B801CEA